MEETEGEIPVRLNRCIRLRQMHSSSKGNLSVVVQHHKAEGSSRVSGLNKAIMRNLQRELQTWYREQSILLEKMNRYQNLAYERWVRIEKMKELTKMRAEKQQDLEKVREEASADRRSSLVALNSAITNVQTNIPRTVEEKPDKEIPNENEEIPEVGDQEVNDLQSETPPVQKETSPRDVQVVQPDATVIEPEVTVKPKSVKLQTKTIQSKLRVPPSPKVKTLPGNLFPNRDTSRRILSSKSHVMDTVLEDNTTQKAPPPPRRSISSPRLSRSRKSSPTGKRQVLSAGQIDMPLPKKSDQEPSISPHKVSEAFRSPSESPTLTRPLNRPQITRSATVCSLPLSGRKKVTLQPRPGTEIKSGRTPRSSNSTSRLTTAQSTEIEDEFTCWRKSRDGSFVAAATQYSRRKFRSPKKRDPKMIEMMLQKESSIQTSNKDKFKNLCQEIDHLDKFNPLTEVKRLFPEFYIKKIEENAKEEMSGQSKILFKLMQAFGAVDKFILDGLDPNSPEALRVCRYLRTKQDPNAGEENVFEGIENLGKKKAPELKLTGDYVDKILEDAGNCVKLPKIELEQP